MIDVPLSKRNRVPQLGLQTWFGQIYDLSCVLGIFGPFIKTVFLLFQRAICAQFEAFHSALRVVFYLLVLLHSETKAFWSGTVVRSFQVLWRWRAVMYDNLGLKE